MFQVQPDWLRSCDSSSAQSPHAGGIFVTFGDGSVRFLSPSVSLKTWQDACDPRDGTVLGPDL
jgi:hypothetical protein